MDKRLKILLIALLAIVIFNALASTFSAWRIDNLKDKILDERLQAKEDSIIYLKSEIKKRNQLIESLYEDLTDTLDGVDNAPVSASHTAITNYLNNRPH